jgi:hypothetical protein
MQTTHYSLRAKGILRFPHILSKTGLLFLAFLKTHYDSIRIGRFYEENNSISLMK